MPTTRPTDSAPNALAALSALSRGEFIARLGDIFEHSPWVPERARAERPFASIDALHAAMVAVVDAASEAEQLALICAHPELAGKEAAAGTLTAHSTGEQRGAGLDQCTPDEIVRLSSLNAEYRARFGFPFVIAVKGLTRKQIMDAIEARLANDRPTEFRACLAQIARIARFRLDALPGAAS